MSGEVARSFTCLVNPHAGGAAGAAAVAVARGLRESGARVEVIHSPGVAAARELASRATEAGDVVVAVGGDGMVASLAGRMVELADRGGVLGFVPSGRGNDFARMLGVPDDVDSMVRRLLHEPSRTVDVIEVSGGARDEVVAGSVYAGVDAEAAAVVARMRRVPRPLQYPLAGVRSLARYVPHAYRLVVDGEVHEVEAATVVVANSAYYGAGMRIAPGALLDDGLLEVVVIGAAGRLELIRAMPQLYDGRHVDHPEVTVLRGRVVELSSYGARDVPVGGDGEDLGVLPRTAGAPLRIAVRAAALQVI
ncbi:MAG: diacylglycerol/lipid kinase family protein [Nocardioides sp.]|uniref:diacylglycerol/lipid kinase family protein n=1 Tax=Nocardioides sp. TaxID=35761 RepID=UPI003F0E2598